MWLTAHLICISQMIVRFNKDLTTEDPGRAAVDPLAVAAPKP